MKFEGKSKRIRVYIILLNLKWVIKVFLNNSFKYPPAMIFTFQYICNFLNFY